MEEQLASSGTTGQFEVNGIPVYFPYAPYPEQKLYMKSVIDACDNGKNALLESPTGTGKTLSLLCSSLAWLNARKANFVDSFLPKILYLSRTHSQLIQVIKELKKTVYEPITTTLGSRDQLCVNSQINTNKGAQLTLNCKKLKKSKCCPFYKGKGERLECLKKKILDIEELHQYGKENHICPYYTSKELLQQADLILMPYNYLLDSKIRATMKTLQYTNSVIIFDEAHNVHRVAEEASSLEISLKEMNRCLEEVRNVMTIWKSIQNNESLYNDMKKELADIKEEELNFIKETISNFIKYMQNFKTSDMKEASYWKFTPIFNQIYEGKRLFDLFLEGTSSHNEDSKKAAKCMNYNSIDKYTSFKLKDKFGNVTEITPSGLKSTTEPKYNGITIENSNVYTLILRKCSEALALKNAGMHLDIWSKIISTIYQYMLHDRLADQKMMTEDDSIPIPKDINDFKMIVVEDAEKFERKKGEKFSPAGGSDIVIKAFCFNPGLAFADLLKSKPRTIILTSGTLSPMDTLESELRLSFPIKLESNHVIGKDQVLLQILKEDSENRKFNFRYQQREDSSQLNQLGQFLQDACAVTPGGILVFFSCYSMMVSCYKLWSKTYIKQIERIWKKKVFREKQSTTQNQAVLNGFRNKLLQPQGGAVLFAVCRGKISEGLDFADEAARLVLMIGVPFPSSIDKRVASKKEYLDQHRTELHFSGKDWYMQEAVRAINQSIGRAIRHKNDYGAIVLLDSRFDASEIKNSLSRWLRGMGIVAENPMQCAENLKNFYNEMKLKNLPTLPALPPPSAIKQLFGNIHPSRLKKKKIEDTLSTEAPSTSFISASSVSTRMEPRSCGQSQTKQLGKSNLYPRQDPLPNNLMEGLSNYSCHSNWIEANKRTKKFHSESPFEQKRKCSQDDNLFDRIDAEISCTSTSKNLDQIKPVPIELKSLPTPLSFYEYITSPPQLGELSPTTREMLTMNISPSFTNPPISTPIPEKEVQEKPIVESTESSFISVSQLSRFGSKPKATSQPVKTIQSI